MEEKIFYNALLVAVRGDRGRMKKLKKGFTDWKTAYNAALHSRSEFLESPECSGEDFPDPEKEWEDLQKHGVRLILADDPEYPPLLREISDPPFGIYVRGDLDSSGNNTNEFKEACRLAIVGTRKSTPEGNRIAERFAEMLTKAGCVIISGLAFGIDAAAHKSTLAAHGRAIAVLASGLAGYYPKTNERLAEKIIEFGGALISEYPLREKPLPSRFLERNRIVSGLSRGVLVIEAPRKSGALSTARFALEHNRDLFVVPGSIDHPNFKGSNQLIRQGATLVTAPEEILESYDIVPEAKKPEERPDLSDKEILILKALQDIGRAANIDKLIDVTKLEPRIVVSTLSFLTVKNLIRETDVGYIIE